MNCTITAPDGYRADLQGSATEIATVVDVVMGRELDDGGGGGGLELIEVPKTEDDEQLDRLRSACDAHELSLRVRAHGTTCSCSEACGNYAGGGLYVCDACGGAMLGLTALRFMLEGLSHPPDVASV